EEVEPVAGAAVYKLDAVAAVERIFGKKSFIVKTFEGIEDITEETQRTFKNHPAAKTACFTHFCLIHQPDAKDRNSGVKNVAFVENIDREVRNAAAINKDAFVANVGGFGIKPNLPCVNN